jgi:hypothetical protein
VFGRFNEAPFLFCDLLCRSDEIPCSFWSFWVVLSTLALDMFSLLADNYQYGIRCPCHFCNIGLIDDLLPIWSFELSCAFTCNNNR